jgi:hypothetical protein
LELEIVAYRILELRCQLTDGGGTEGQRREVADPVLHDDLVANVTLHEHLDIQCTLYTRAIAQALRSTA